MNVSIDPKTAEAYAAQWDVDGVSPATRIRDLAMANIDRAQVAFERDQARVADRNILSGADFSNQIFHRRRNP